MVQIEYMELINLAGLILSFSIGWIARYYAYIYANSKKKIRSIRQLIDNVDDALYDDKVNDEEFQKIFESAKAVIQK
jgi:hypothetical protein